MTAPKLRFKEFDGDWIKSKLGSEAQFFQGEQVSLDDQCSEYAHGLIKFLRIENFTQKSKDFRYIRYTGSQEKILGEQDIAIVRYGATAGFICSGETGVIANNLFKVSVDNKKINQKYLELVLKSEKTFNYFQAEMSGGAMPALNFKIVGNLDITYSSIQEQTKIASFLSNVDEKISQLTQKHELLGQYKQGMMQKLFSQQIRFKADDSGEFGEWEDKPLNEIASKRSGKNKDGSISEVLTNSATQGIIKQSDYFEREIVTESNLNGYYIVNLDDFVYNPRISVHAPVGPIKRNKKCLGVMSPLYTVFTVIQGNLKYLEYFFDSNFWHDYVKGVANSGARHDRMNITNKDFFDMPILYPCLEEQTKIANFLSAIDQKIEVVAQQIEQAKTWKKGLLQQMFV